MKNIKFGATGVEEILQNVAFILSTAILSCPLDREFGWNMGIDEPIQLRKARIIHDVTEAIGNFEPRAIVESVEVDGDGLAGKLTPRVKVRINDESI
ncbi:GPW/gp25 family protein [Lysinibacillus irui]|uniref:GPW/gp25 family protein n=1 Tax=Lysinibacillus irui TaxID=2998077 RepID=UPI002AD3B921|nr:GPW/gp25 family protein [Lysinibacillus irui]MEA0565299.1 GPW/gp25 family protein [Lysinibacillus irui]